MSAKRKYKEPIKQKNELHSESVLTGSDGMIKARLALDSHFGNPTARRMTNYDTREFDFGDGRKGNVYVSSYDNLVTPQIQEVDGNLEFIEDVWSDDNAKRSYKQSMKFESNEDAQFFGENYKKYAPMMKLEKGGQFGFTPGGKWEIVEDFKGATHEQGGIDVKIGGGNIKRQYKQ